MDVWFVGTLLKSVQLSESIVTTVDNEKRNSPTIFFKIIPFERLHHY